MEVMELEIVGGIYSNGSIHRVFFHLDPVVLRNW